METISGKQFVKNVTLLTIAAFISKGLAVLYRVPYQNITGDIGFYVYQQIYPFYAVAFILSMYGFPVVISKLVAEKSILGDSEGASNVLAVSLWLLTSIGITLFAGLYIAAPFLARFVGDSDLVNAYRMVSFSFLIIPVVALLRGLFQAEGNTLPTAVSQITEQTVRVVTIVLLSYFLIAGGFNIYAAGAGAAFGSVTGSLAGFLVLLLFLKRKNRFAIIPRLSIVKHAKIGQIARKLLLEGVLISISALAFVLFQLIDAVTVLNQLMTYGLSEYDAKTVKGIFDRGQPLLQLGTTVALSLSFALVPVIAKSSRKEASEKAGFALKISLLVGLAASSGLAVVIEPTNMMLYTDVQGSFVLALLAATILFSSVALTSIAIMQGLGHVYMAAFFIVSGLLLKTVGNLIFIPMFGIKAAALATVSGFLLTALLSVFFVHRKLALFHTYRFHSLRILFAIVIMVCCSGLWRSLSETMLNGVLAGRLAAAVVALTTVVVGVVIYVGLLLAFRVFSEAELTFLPKADKLRVWMKKYRQKGV